MSKDLYFVHCVDTEGPLNETMDATFERLKDIFGIDLPAEKETLRKLQNKEIPLNGLEDAVCNLIAPKRLKMNKTWHEIDEMLDRITAQNFRNRLTDSDGNGWCYNWFCMDHVGFTGYNPRHRDAGYHNIFDHYRRLSEKHPRDDVQFHYHPLPINGDYNAAGTAYLNSGNLYDILARKVIDRNWFPAAFRPGFHAERPDANWFLEQWIPFDFANQNKQECSTDQPDLGDGRWGFWENATTEWEVYHPSLYDYQSKGFCKRLIARCLNMEARLRELSEADIREAFARADSDLPTLVSFCNHDFRDMQPEIEKVRDMIAKIAPYYPEVRFHFSRATDAVRKVCDVDVQPPDLSAEWQISTTGKAVLTVTVSNEIMGTQPFLAIKTYGNQYFWENFDFTRDHKIWKYTFDSATFIPRAIEKIGVACNSVGGVTDVVVIDTETEKITKKRYNPA